jgi:DNA-binding transcriptional ArsR family regulator
MNETTSSLTQLPPEQLERAAECLRTLSHPVRLQMVDLMLQGRFTVGELAETCGVLHHVASEHLRLMQHCQLLGREKKGRKTYYTIAEPSLAAIMNCIHNRFGAKESSRT